MTNQHESFPDLMHEDSFEVVMRGYNRRQVHDYMNRNRNQIRDLEERLARAIEQAERGRIELAEVRRRLSDAPQDYDELGQRLSQILKLGEEEAASKRQVADAEASKLREDAAEEAQRMVSAALERAEGIMNAAQQEAERRVAEATAAAEQMLAQAGGDAEETLNAARAESEETLRGARAEADRMVVSARNEAERTIESARTEAESTVSSANAEAHATLAAAQQRSTILDETTGRRVTYLTDTHREVMRRLNEMGAVLGDLLHRENAAGALIDEASVLPLFPVQSASVPVPVEAAPAGEVAGPDVESDVESDVEAVRVIVDDEVEEGGDHRTEIFDDTDVSLGRAAKEDDEYAARK
ncbi:MULTISPECIES: hypothetical protein [Streptosporangium]|uniref:Cell division septum initiation protein DivIVA n=1 Tax=Streptosporangium brasiliense TaxID=47480 RepID=A0ABT9R7Q0_9ACTN|nr:hypothetical protein [Streptosporangium brasiliense]MDP9864425.1 cell division septum initiation protein DivIVA [Streptosporangium brasiliense]